MKKRTNMIRLVACLALLLSSATLVVAQQAAVKIFAHRGGKLEYDENTMQAFRQVYEKGLRGYEIDIRITKDNHLVVFHDADFKRVLGIEGSVETSTLNEIKALRTKKGNPIPTADEVIEFFNSKSGLYVEFEMKTKSPLYEPELLERYCDMLYQKVYANMPEGSEYLMTSFDTRPLKYLGDKYPQVEMLLISLWPGHSVEDFLLGVALGSDYLCTDVPVAVTDWVNEHGSWITLK